MDVSRGRQVLPEGLASMPPGPALSVMLAGIDRSRVAAQDLRDLVRARARQVAFEQAQLLADVLDAGRSALAEEGSLERAPDWDPKYGPDIVGWMLGVSTSWAQTQLELAQGLIDRLPRVYAALRAGEVDLAKASAFVDALSGVADDEVARRIADRLVARACGWTLTQLRERLRYHVDRADPASARRRYQRRVADRGLSLRPEPDGTAALSAWGLAPHRAAAAFDRVDRLARAARLQGDTRTLRQLRADACLDLLTGTPFQITPTVDPVTAAADAAFPGDVEEDRWDADREAVPPEWFAAPRAEEAPEWWRRATHRRPRPSLDELIARAEGRSRSQNGNDEEPVRDYGDAARATDPEPEWWVRASTVRPAQIPDGDSRFENGKPAEALPGDRCTCRRVIPAPQPGSVELQLKLSTLAGLDDDPGLIPGFGPVLAEIARQVALDRANPTWRYSVFGDDGTLAHHGITRRRPTARDSAFVRARDRSCRTPTCRRRASRTELDHRLPWANGGPTLPWNLDCRCGRHHDLKELPGVTVARHDATTTITLPCGNTYHVTPDKDLILINE